MVACSNTIDNEIHMDLQTEGQATDGFAPCHREASRRDDGETESIGDGTNHGIQTLTLEEMQTRLQRLASG